MGLSFWRKILLVWMVLAAIPAAAAEWPKSDIASDPAIRRGVLANGMRYAILRNETPSGAVAVRLSFAVGSSYEEADQRGFSHFVEHMAFRGSKNFPDGDINKTLERLGLRFGPDTNASTGQTMTSYMFNLPSAKGLDEVLAISRDIAGNLNLDAKTVENEAGVVMSEAALRRDPGFRAFLSQFQFELRDKRATAMPGSEASILEHPTVEALTAYYRKWYRPERAVLTVVGDVDPDTLAKQIAGRFSDWKGSGRGEPGPDFHVPMDRGLEARLYTEAGAPARLSATWVKPPLARPVRRAEWKRYHIYSVALQIANRRLSALAAAAEQPFTGVSAGQGEVPRAAEFYSLQVNLGEHWQSALSFLAQARRALLEAPPTQAEIDSVVTAQTASAQRAEAAANTRSTPGLANTIASDAILDDVTVSPAQDRAALDTDIAGLTPETVSAAFRAVGSSRVDLQACKLEYSIVSPK